MILWVLLAAIVVGATVAVLIPLLVRTARRGRAPGTTWRSTATSSPRSSATGRAG